MKIQAIGVTYKKEGGVDMMLETPAMPADCVVLFLLNEDYEELKVILKQVEVKE